jgi:Tfp pilus assembly protein PilO
MHIDKPLTTGIILLLIFLVGFFLVFPKYKEFKRTQLTLEEKKAEFNAKYEYYANVSDIYHKIQDRKDDFKKIDDALPDNPNLGRLAYYFEAASKENGLLLKDFTLSKLSVGQSDPQTPGEVGFALDLFGDYNSLVNFIISLEKSAKLFEVDSVAFKSSDNQSGAVAGSKIKGQGLFDFTLQVKTSFY